MNCRRGLLPRGGYHQHLEHDRAMFILIIFFPVTTTFKEEATTWLTSRSTPETSP